MGNAIQDLLLRIGGDSSGGQQATRDLANALSNTLVKALQDTGQKADESGQKVSGFAKYVDELKPKTDSAHASFTSLHATLSEMWENPTAGAKQFAGVIGTELSSALAGAGGALGETAIVAGGVAAVLAVAGVAAFEFAEKAAKVGGALEDLHLKTGMSVEGLSKLSYAAQVAGGSIDQIANAMFMFEKQAGNDAPKVEHGMELIGLRLAEIKKLKPEDQFTAIAKALAETEDATVRNAAGADIFGRSYRDLAPLIMKMNDALALTKDLNPWSEEEAKQAEEFEMHLASIHVHFDAIATSLGRSVLPSVDHFVGALEFMTHWTPSQWMQMLMTGNPLVGTLGIIPLDTPKAAEDVPLPKDVSTTIPNVGLAEKEKFDAQIAAEQKRAQEQYIKEWQHTEDEIQKIWGEAFVAGAAIDTKSIAGQLAVLEQKRVNDENAAAIHIAETTKSEDQLGQLILAIRAKYAALEDDAIQKATEKNIAESEAAGLAAAAAVSKAFAGPQTILKDLLISMGAVPISLHSILTPAQEMGQVMTDVTVTMKEHFDDLNDTITGDFTNLVKTLDALGVHTRGDLQLQLDADRKMYQEMLAAGDLYTAAEKEQLRQRIENETAALDDFQSHLQTTLAGIGAFGTALSTVGQVAGPGFTQIGTAIAGVTKGLSEAEKAMAALSAPDGAGMNVGNLAALASGWIGIATAVASYVIELVQANHQADEIHKTVLLMRELSSVFLDATTLSNKLATSIRSDADSVDLYAAAVARANEIVGRDVSKNPYGATYDPQTDVVPIGGRGARPEVIAQQQQDKQLLDDIDKAFATALNIVAIINELGGVVALTAAQFSTVQESIDQLFIMIGIGGSTGVRAGKELDDVLTLIAGSTHLTAQETDLLQQNLSHLMTVAQADGPGAAQAVQTINDVLGKLGQQAIDSGGIVDQFFLDMADQARAAGIQLDSVTTFFQTMAANAATALNDLLQQPLLVHTREIGKAVDDARDALDKLTTSGKASASDLAKAQRALTDALAAQHDDAVRNKQALDDLGASAMVAFNAGIASGLSFEQSLQAIAPQLGIIRQAYQDLGLSIDDVATKGLLLENTILNGTPDAPSGLGKAIDGLNALITAARNLGPAVETADAAAAQQRTLKSLYTQAQANSANAGVTGDAGTAAALEPFQATLHQLQEWATKNNVELDQNSKDMITQSQQLGIWNDDFKSDSQKNRESIADLIKSQDHLAGIMGGVAGAIAGATAGQPPSGAWAGGLVTPFGVAQYLESGGTASNWPWLPQGTDTVPAMLTPGERVLSVAQTHAFETLTSGGGGGLFPNYPSPIPPSGGGLGGASPTVSSGSTDPFLASANAMQAAAALFREAVERFTGSTGTGAPGTPPPVVTPPWNPPGAGIWTEAPGAPASHTYQVNVVAKNPVEEEQWLREWMRRNGVEITVEEIEDGRFVSRLQRKLTPEIFT